MNHENEPERLPVCNFCEKEYDPYDRHTCAGNNIESRLRKPVEDEFSPSIAYPELGLTRQQIGEALDAERASALKVQPGGDHYRKLKIQPIEYIVANCIGFCAGNVVKYATRYKDKGGAEDIRKIKHYCDLILEFEYGEK